jgi:hypothetical protein
MRKQSVTAFLETLQHTRKPEINRVRNIILGAHPDLVEKIKWNAPSFGLEEDDRITFRLQPGNKVDLIFHRGVARKDDEFAFTDETGLLKFVAPDRAVLEFSDATDIEVKTEQLRWLVRAWIAAT